jgi:hypothetical protein
VKNLKVAYIEPQNGRQAGTRIEVLFNPAEYSIEKGNTYQSTSLPGLATPVSQFVTGNADTLSMELFFDTYSPSSRHTSVRAGQDVRDFTRPLSSLLDVDPDLHAPPIVRFIWGPPLGSPEGLHFTATIEKLSQRFTMFLDDGTPVRATLNVTFKEYKTVEEQLQEIGRESADRSKRHTLKDGDSLWFLAAQSYNDPEEWRAIAVKNRIENPRILAPGQQIEIPPLGIRKP